MASIFGHFTAGYTLGRLVTKKMTWKLIVLALVSSFIPDADVISFEFGIPYQHLFGHRGFTHSIVFAMLWATLLTLFFKKGKGWAWLIIFLATMSHGVLDAMTSGGEGVAFFAPFDNSRYFFPWRPIKVSPIGAGKFFSEWGLRVLWSELLWIGLPCIALLVTNRYLLKR